MLAVGGLAWFAIAVIVGLIVGPILGGLSKPFEPMAASRPAQASAGRRTSGPSGISRTQDRRVPSVVAGRPEPGDRPYGNEWVRRIG